MSQLGKYSTGLTKSLFRFSVRWYGKAQMNFLVNSIQSLGSFKNLKASSLGFFNVYLT